MGDDPHDTADRAGTSRAGESGTVPAGATGATDTSGTSVVVREQPTGSSGAPDGSDGSAVARGARADSDPATPATRSPVERMSHNPAVDGLRGLAVAAVLCFHGGFPWARGGYLGVSTFFTVSGFVVTALLITEHRTRGRIDLSRFWSRRARRLLPAAAVVLAGTMVAAVLWDETWRRALPGDLVASLLQVANWRFLLEDQDYGDLFAQPSPVLHFWSLSIEAQFYLVFPLVLAGVMGVARGSLRAVAAVLVGLLGVSAAVTLAMDGHSAVYYASPARMGEILVGSLVAVVVLSDRGVRALSARRLAPLAGVAGVLALGASVWAWWQVEQTSLVLDRGGLLAYAAVSGVLVLAVSVTGPLRRALAFAPLRALGVISYGVYLIHWPVFLLVTEERTAAWLEPLGLEPGVWPVFGLKLAVTLVLATVSYRLVEQPVRTGRWPRGRWLTPALAVGTLAAVVVAAVVVPRRVSVPADDFLPLPEQGSEPVARATGPGDVDSQGTDAQAAGPRAGRRQVGVGFGDSTALRTGWGLNEWGDSTGRLAIDALVAGMGCGLARGGERLIGGEAAEGTPECERWAREMGEAAADAREAHGDQVSFALVQFGPWDVVDRRLEGDDRWLHVGDPEYDRYLRDEIAAAMDVVRREGLVVVWLTSPPIDLGRGQVPPPAELPEASDPVRMARFNELVVAEAAGRPGVQVVDLAGWVADLPQGEDERMRPDGVHFEVETAREVAREWLGDAVLRAVRDGRRAI